MTERQQEIQLLLHSRDTWRAAGNEALAAWYDQCARLVEHHAPPEHPAEGQGTLFHQQKGNT